MEQRVMLIKAWLSRRYTKIQLCEQFNISWPAADKWINVNSIAMFARQSPGNFANASKDVMYDLLKQPDINWRKLNLSIANQVNKTPAIKHSQIRAFMLDDTVKVGSGLTRAKGFPVNQCV